MISAAAGQIIIKYPTDASTPLGSFVTQYCHRGTIEVTIIPQSCHAWAYTLPVDAERFFRDLSVNVWGLVPTQEHWLREHLAPEQLGTFVRDCLCCAEGAQAIHDTSVTAEGTQASALPGHLCEVCLDAPATATTQAPWGGDMGVCTTCLSLPAT